MIVAIDRQLMMLRPQFRKTTRPRKTVSGLLLALYCKKDGITLLRVHIHRRS
ncbi:hypothetical protein CAEBREN_20201 [Caenorhabditis brenneri]|uniref:Uncharacterized protein n=1 Tax=Caenorhabditis brenneri TaxID=135651 RepID=G0MQI9_CAEBE|nr:hypothetical protein CAEBREN_20201 [Caenorhabditis brenneri]